MALVSLNRLHAEEVDDLFTQRVVGPFADIQPRNLFAQPELEEVVVTARTIGRSLDLDPIVPKGLSPGVFGTALEVAGRVLNPLVMLLTPGYTGPRGTGELYEDMQKFTPQAPDLLEEVVVNPPRPPSNRNPDASNVPDQRPPNWNDLVDWKTPHDIGLFLFPLLEIPRGDTTRIPIGDPIRDPLPGQPAVLPRPIGVPAPAAPTLDPGIEFEPRRSTPAAPSVPAPDIFTTPWLLPQPGPLGDPSSQPTPSGKPRPGPSARPLPTPEPFVPELDPWANPTPTRTPTREPKPAPSPVPRGEPHDPSFGPNGFLDPITNRPPDPFAEPFVPKPPKEADPCNCDKEKKPKKKKKSEPRSVCYKGTYRQLRKGIIYNRGAEVPCDAASKRAPSKSPKSIGDLADIMFPRS